MQEVTSAVRILGIREAPSDEALNLQLPVTKVLKFQTRRERKIFPYDSKDL